MDKEIHYIMSMTMMKMMMMITAGAVIIITAEKFIT